MRHYLYMAMLARLSDYERTLANALERNKPNWWQASIHPQTMLDYLNAQDDSSRISAMVTMARDAINLFVVGRDALHAV